ncbi:glutathione peroxidase [Rhodovulum iodosum]|uniref:Glutathione peroxidase n=1 Tax=Rhodovulum iodosum TaxID=68291 RepID=A0ABV3XPU8_9RHOB|nr:glutathione peroxidase [Rhodovulum robiginosum]RSK31575.1 glutathione peroxidase [Rhodovulum robiginosum]
MRLFAALMIVIATALPSSARESFSFASIDGGEISLDDYAGRPVLVVNTASRCGFTPQYDDLQTLHERYGPKGLLVLAVPSDDFRQELSSEQEVKDFCDTNFGLTLPMTEITHVKGKGAHPFYRWLAKSKRWEPGWNFNKVLLDGDGEVVVTYGSFLKPTAPKLTRKIEQLLAQ